MLESFCLLTLAVLAIWSVVKLTGGNHTSDRETIVFGYLSQMTEILNKESLDNCWSSNFNPFERKFFVGRGSNFISYNGSEQENPAILYDNRFGLFFRQFSHFYPQSVVLEVSEEKTNGVFNGKITFIIKGGGLSEEQTELIKKLIKECKDKIKTDHSPISEYYHI